MTEGQPERIGVFGGTFDPPHIGHLVAALEVRDRHALDRVLMVPANIPWQKVGSRAISPAPIRLEMVRAAVEELPGLEVADLEVRRGGDSYTIDTVTALLDEAPDRELSVIVGADTAGLVDTWKRVDELRELVELVIVTRGDERPEVTWDRVSWVSVPRLDVSSSDLRSRVAQGRSTDVLVPRPVQAVIDRHGLYRGGE